MDLLVNKVSCIHFFDATLVPSERPSLRVDSKRNTETVKEDNQ